MFFFSGFVYQQITMSGIVRIIFIIHFFLYTVHVCSFGKRGQLITSSKHHIHVPVKKEVPSYRCIWRTCIINISWICKRKVVLHKHYWHGQLGQITVILIKSQSIRHRGICWQQSFYQIVLYYFFDILYKSYHIACYSFFSTHLTAVIDTMTWKINNSVL